MLHKTERDNEYKNLIKIIGRSNKIIINDTANSS